MQPLLPLIERLSLFPAETLLAVPAQPEDTLRGVLVLRGLARQLGQEAVALRREQAQARVGDRRHGGRGAATGRGTGDSSRRRPPRSTGRSPPPRRAAGRPKARPRQPRSAPPPKRRGPRRCAACWRNSRPSAGGAGAGARGRARAERQKRADAAAAARQRQADLARPAGAGTIASAAQPRGQLTAPVAGTIVRAWGDADGRRAGHRHFVPCAAGGTRGRRRAAAAWRSPPRSAATGCC